MTADGHPTIDRLDREELVLQFDRDTAWALGIALVEKARTRAAPVTVDVRRNGQQLLHAALPGTAPDNDA